MKKRVRKLFLMASILCVVSLVVCACGGKKLEQIDAVETAPTQQPEESGETPSEEKASTLESFTENTFENGKTAIRIWKEVLRNSRKDSSQL